LLEELGGPMTANLPQIYKFEEVEMILRGKPLGSMQTTGKVRLPERMSKNVKDIYWRPHEGSSDTMLNIL
jgi:hypothetical protein